MSRSPVVSNTCLGLVALALWMGADSACAQMHGADAHAGPTMNFHEIDVRLATGGHFVDGGLAALHEAGVQVVIDLRDKPPEGQQERVAALGIEWINVPVVWKDPKRIDFERFSAEMSKYNDKKVLVQCQANYRASAMTYLYRVTVEQIPEDVARQDLNAVWEPQGQWREFMDAILQ